MSRRVHRFDAGQIGAGIGKLVGELLQQRAGRIPEFVGRHHLHLQLVIPPCRFFLVALLLRLGLRRRRRGRVPVQLFLVEPTTFGFLSVFVFPFCATETEAMGSERLGTSNVELGSAN